MKKKNQLVFTVFLMVTQQVFSQSDVSGAILGHTRSNNTYYVGWSPGVGSIAGPLDIRNNFGNQPINFFTGGTQRMVINGSGGISAGYVGIGNTTPLSRLHVYGTGTLGPTGSGWKRAITISDGALVFTAANPTVASPTFFMAYPSAGPAGNLFAGTSEQLIGGINPVDYAYQVSSTSAIGGVAQNPLNSMQFFKNVLIYPNINVGILDATNERRFGVNTFDPQNVVHINTAATSAIPGNSGLRLQDLTSASTPLPVNPGPGVLSVNASGDVVYVPGGANNGLSVDVLTGKVVLGQDESQSPDIAQLLNNRVVPMNTKTLNFKGGFVNVNSLPGETTLAGLNVRPGNDAFVTPPYSIYNANRALNVINENQRPIGIEANAHDIIGSAYALGVVGSASSVNPAIASTVAGVDGYGDGLGLSGGSQGGVFGLRGTSKNSISESYGVFGIAEGTSPNSVGVYGLARGTSTNAYGIYGKASGGANNYAGWFDGFTYINANLEVNGVVNASNGTPLTSDVSLKTNINPITDAMDIVNSLEPKSFYFDTLNSHGFNFLGTKNYGFIAQEVELILPELVHEAHKNAQYDSLGNEVIAAYDYKTLNYNAFIGILTKAVQEQQTQIEEKDSLITDQQSQINDLNARLSQLENCLSALLPTLCEANQMAVQQTPQEIQRELAAKIQVKLSDKNTIVLAQNVPNPFAESTTIAYSIPNTVKQAQVHFYNAQGKLIQSVEISERGNGEMTVFADDLSSGQYSYNLVADGKVVATKKMVKL